MRYEDANSKLEAYEAAALKSVNKARAEIGLAPLDKLEPGYRGKAAECVISNSITAGAPAEMKLRVSTAGGVSRLNYKAVEGKFIFKHTVDRRETINLGPEVANFIVEFDGGRYPELDFNPVRRSPSW